MPTVLVIGTLEGKRVSPATLEAVSAARLLANAGGSIVGGLAGHDLAEAGAQLATSGLAQLWTVDDGQLAGYLGDCQVAATEAIARAADADVVLIPADADANEWAPRLASRLGAALVPGCLGAEWHGSQLVARRAICGGSLIATYAIQRRQSVLVMAPGLHPQAGLQGSPCPIEPLAMPPVTARLSLLATTADVGGDGPPLKTAKAVISGGVGVATQANWRLLEEAALALGAAVGASRAAVEIGLAPANRQVGFSGLKVAPDLYLAAGISGAVHHLAGIGGARKVVAINKDPEAPIFKAAHLGVVGDLAEVLPAFTARLRELKS
jgi:electron transfer flavoprotein alpha subunit